MARTADWHEAENTVVRALRDVLLGWCEADSAESAEFVVRLLREGIEMQRRVALFAINAAWDHCSFDDVLAPSECFNPAICMNSTVSCRPLCLPHSEQKDKTVQRIGEVALDDASEEGRAHFQARHPARDRWSRV